MKYNEFKKMMEVIRQGIKELKGLYDDFLPESRVNAITIAIMNHIVHNYFWDYDENTYSCNFNMLEKAVRNTVHHALRAY